MFVYLIRCGSRGPIKIGIAKNVESRLSSLQTANPYELSLIAKVKCDSRRHALEMETRLHKVFSQKRIRGEWFKGNINLKTADNVLKVDYVNNESNQQNIDAELDLKLLAESPL